MIPLPACRWRGESVVDRHACHSSKFVGAINLVPAAFCRTCGYADHVPPPPLPRALPCVHLGAAQRAPGKAFACAVHAFCHPARRGHDPLPADVRPCADCADYLPCDPFGPSSAEMRRRADAFLAAVPDYPAGRYRGRGVVIAGGGDRYFAALYVTVRALRHVGCRLPIQVWYLGRAGEMPPARRALLAPYDVECVDADAVRRTHPARRLDGWELKVFATLHSPFAEVLFLDADCYPCRNPEFLFDDADYRAAGAVFWPDILPADPRLHWPAFGVPDPQRPGSVESGQFVLHKERAWRPLNLAWFYNDHSDYYYGYGYGDKHTFEVAWARCATPFVMWQPTARWAEVAYLHGGPDDAPLFVHRCADKFCLQPAPFSTPQRHAGQAYHAQLPLEAECWGWLADLAQALGPGSPAARRRAAGGPVPERVVRIGLGRRFNCSILAHHGRLLLASRRGETGGRIDLSELRPDFQPLRTHALELNPADAGANHEDPRLFVVGDQLHCAFTGATHDGRDWQVGVVVCRLGADDRVEAVWRPDYPDRAWAEKNWQFFEHAGALHCVYTIAPHVILRHDGPRAVKVAQTTAPFDWPGCHLRGGAPPVRVGDEYYHFFHAVDVRRHPKVYTAGVYTFAARPPFEVRRIGPTPILWPDEYDRPEGWNVSVVYPCGAVLRDGQWLLSYGYHDRECRIAVFAADAIERHLRPV